MVSAHRKYWRRRIFFVSRSHTGVRPSRPLQRSFRCSWLQLTEEPPSISSLSIDKVHLEARQQLARSAVFSPSFGIPALDSGLSSLSPFRWVGYASAMGRSVAGDFSVFSSWRLENYNSMPQVITSSASNAPRQRLRQATSLHLGTI